MLKEHPDPKQLEERMKNGLLGQWYIVASSEEVSKKPINVERLGKRLVLWRTQKGNVVVQEDRCPHRGAPLSLGYIAENYIVCRYHGIQINEQGIIACVPAIKNCPMEGQKKVKTFPCIENFGAIWAYFGIGSGHDPIPLEFPAQLQSEEYARFFGTVRWECNYIYALENIVDPMHAPFVHSASYTLSGGSKSDELGIEELDGGFRVYRLCQRDLSFDWVELHYKGSLSVLLEIPYPKTAGPGGNLIIVCYYTPINEAACQLFFGRIRKVSGWQRDMWTFLYKNRLEERHFQVLEQDRIILEGIQKNARFPETLYQHDIGVVRLRRLIHELAKTQIKT